MCTHSVRTIGSPAGTRGGDALLRANCRRNASHNFAAPLPEVLFTRTFHEFYIRRRVLRISIRRLLRFFSPFFSFFLFKFNAQASIHALGEQAVPLSAIEIFLNLDKDGKLIFFMNYTWIVSFRIFVGFFKKCFSFYQ